MLTIDWSVKTEARKRILLAELGHEITEQRFRISHSFQDLRRPKLSFRGTVWYSQRSGAFTERHEDFPAAALETWLPPRAIAPLEAVLFTAELELEFAALQTMVLKKRTPGMTPPEVVDLLHSWTNLRTWS